MQMYNTACPANCSRVIYSLVLWASVFAHNGDQYAHSHFGFQYTVHENDLAYALALKVQCSLQSLILVRDLNGSLHWWSVLKVHVYIFGQCSLFSCVGSLCAPYIGGWCVSSSGRLASAVTTTVCHH